MSESADRRSGGCACPHPIAKHRISATEVVAPKRIPSLSCLLTGATCRRYVAWVTAAFGPFWGFQEGWWSWLSGVTDNSVYPVLFLTYLDAVVPGSAPSLPCTIICPCR